jgi:hypothetical protein
LSALNGKHSFSYWAGRHGNSSMKLPPPHFHP